MNFFMFYFLLSILYWYRMKTYYTSYLYFAMFCVILFYENRMSAFLCFDKYMIHDENKMSKIECLHLLYLYKTKTQIRFIINILLYSAWYMKTKKFFNSFTKISTNKRKLTLKMYSHKHYHISLLKLKANEVITIFTY